MAFFISSLINGMDQMEDIAGWVNALGDPGLGIELIAFTHDGHYWRRLELLLETLSCLVTFHGPYIGTEATAPEGSEEHMFLLESYERVLRLASAHDVRHVVYHYTQKGFDAAGRGVAQAAERCSREQILQIARRYSVTLLIENLAAPAAKLPLYTPEEYAGLFEADPALRSIIDIGHAHLNHMDLEGFLKKHGSAVKAYHFHNNNKAADSHQSIFDGTFDFEGFSGLYHAYTNDADIVLEYEHHVNLTHQELLEQIRWLRNRYC